MSASQAEEQAPAQGSTLLSPGELVDGRYRIESYLGGGGMASVYRATHIVLEQPVAIKVVSAQIRELPGMAQRFLREARAATQLKSEHVARVSDVGTMPDGAPYMVMEYLDGRDLDAVVESSDELSVEDAVDYVLQACEALAEVHGLGIVHRDLKPANLFLTKGADGLACVKLIDFGISRTDSPLSPREASSLTHPDTVMGSPRYMSPEQMESATKADSRSDIYGIGAVLYELLTKKAPHEGETFLDIYAAATLGPPVSPSAIRPAVPTELDEVILRCLEIDPAKRWVDAAELAFALAQFGPEGSLARADAIARILDAARTRGREATGTEEHVSDDEGSRVRRRVSPSAHALRMRRKRRSFIAVAVLAFGGLAYGGRALYTEGHASGVATATATVAPTAPVAPTDTVTPTTTAAPTAARVLTPSEAAAAAVAAAVSATNAATATAAEATAAAKAAPATRPVAALPAAPPPRTTPAWTTAPPPPAPTTDERKLFEDRK